MDITTIEDAQHCLGGCFAERVKGGGWVINEDDYYRTATKDEEVLLERAVGVLLILFFARKYFRQNPEGEKINAEHPRTDA